MQAYVCIFLFLSCMELSPLLFKVFNYISAAYTLVPFIIAIKHFNYLNRDGKILTYLLAASVLTEVISNVLSYIFHVENLRFLNLYIIVETALIAWFYISTFINKSLAITSIVIVTLFILYALFNFFTSATQSFDHIVMTSESIMVILFSFIGFHHLLKYSLHQNILGVPMFWFNAGFLIYFSGNLFLHLFSNYLLEHALYTFFEMWAIWHSLLNIIFYTLLSIGLWKTRTFQISNS